MKEFRGVGVALITPFKSGGGVDFEALTALLNHTQHVDYYVVLGTTAETATLTADERHDVVRHVVGHNKGQKPIVVGIGGNNTAEVVGAIKSFDLSGVDAILSVVPYYNKPTQEGIYQHYMAIIESSTLPIMLYNVPGRTGVNMTAKTTLRIAHKFAGSGKLIGVKEASGIASQATYILRDRPTDFLVISGDDNMSLPLISLGADGVISVSANAFRTMSDMVHSALDGDFKVAAGLNLRLHEVTDMLFLEGNPAGVKAALAIKGVIGNELRLPLVPVSNELQNQIKNQIQKYDL